MLLHLANDAGCPEFVLSARTITTTRRQVPDTHGNFQLENMPVSAARRDVDPARDAARKGAVVRSARDEMPHGQQFDSGERS